MSFARLHLGLLGFSPQETADLESMLARREDIAATLPTPHAVRWEIVNFDNADALFVNLKRAQPGEDGTVLIEASEPDGFMAMTLPHLQLPTALAHSPAWVAERADQDFRAGTRPAALQVGVDTTDPRSVVQALDHLEAALTRRLALHHLCSQLMERRAELDWSRAYHLTRSGELLVGINMPERRVLLRDGLTLRNLHDVDWERRPPGAVQAMNGFSQWTLEEAAWIYAMHCEHVNLPMNWLKDELYFRRLPPIRSVVLYARHHPLLRLLNTGVWTLQTLQRVDSLDQEWLLRDLFALHMTRSLSTEPNKAAAHLRGSAPASGTRPVGGREAGESLPSGLLPAASVHDWGSDVDNALPTIPSQLR